MPRADKVSAMRLEGRVALEDVVACVAGAVRGEGAANGAGTSPGARVLTLSRELGAGDTGFAPTFHRLTIVPEAEGEESRWVLVGGPASSAGKPVLRSLADRDRGLAATSFLEGVIGLGVRVSSSWDSSK